LTPPVPTSRLARALPVSAIGALPLASKFSI